MTTVAQERDSTAVNLIKTLALLIICLIPIFSYAQEWEAELYSLEGSAQRKPAQSTSWEEAKVGLKLFPGDTIQVGTNSRVALQFRSGYFVRLSSQAKLDIHPSKDASLNLSSGKLHLFNRTSGDNPTIETPIVSAAVRGTEGVISVEPTKVTVDILEGAAEVSNRYGAVSLTSQQRAVTTPLHAPQKTVIVSNLDSVQWTLSLPSVASPQDKNRIPNEVDKAQSYIARLAAGKTDELRKDFDGSEHTSPPLALAYSYFLQSQKKLPETYETIKEALSKYPEHSLLLGRAAELALYFGEVDKAQEYIHRACGTTCTDPQLQTIQGFIQLITDDAETALQSFRESISKNPEFSTSHLGAALALVHQDKMNLAQEELLKAVHLDPTISVYRSYLGKLFFERDQESQALNELAEAVRLDPLDPTPDLYKGFVKLSQNDPLGAIQDIEQSIAKNDNRAVYRSSLLLDQDNAARSAALGRIFIEAGFQDAARIEAIRSTVKDPSNFSAHRLLWETQDPIFYADGALSELRIAKLLAPVNTNLNQTSGASPGLNSYDSFFERNNSRTGLGYVFDGRDNIHTPSAETVGRTDHLAWGISAASAFSDGFKQNSYGRDTLASGATEYELDWNQKIRLEGEGRFISTKDVPSGDEEVDTTEGKGALSYVYHRNSDETFLLDLGADRVLDRLHYPFSDRFLSLSTIFEGETTTAEDDLLIDQILHENTNLYHAGLQYIFDGDDFSVIAGSQLLHQNPDRREDSLILEDSEGFLTGLGASLKNESDTEITGHDAYVYTTAHPIDALDITLGLTRTDLESDIREIPPYLDETRHEGRFNPKIGGVFELDSHLFLRTSYVETLRKSSLEDQTSLEPTYVGGLNQRFNDLSATLSRNSGVGIDWKDPGELYAGAEYTYRRVTEDLRGVTEEIIGNFDTGESGYSITGDDRAYTHRGQHLVRSYLDKRLNNSFAVLFEYRHAEDDGTDPGDDEALANDTLSGAVRWFDPSGLFAYTKASWLRQDLTFHDPFPDGVETTWLFDAGIGMRLPHRKGKVLIEVLNFLDKDFVLDQSSGFSTFVKPETAVLARLEFNW